MARRDLSAGTNSLGTRIRSREFLIGSVLSFPGAALAELASAPFDFVWVDLEHSALSVPQLQTVVIGAKAAGCPALARLPRYDSEHLTAVLDTGVDGIVAPMVETADEAAALVRRMRYPPAGSRGFGPRRAGSYGRRPAYWSSADARLACLVQIETLRAVEAIEEIVAVEGVDAVVVGCSDLSFALGTPLDPLAEPVISAVRAVQAAASCAGVASGIAAAAPPEAIAQLVADSSTIVVYSADVGIYSRAVDAAAEAVRGACNRARRR